jgi:hypothetical protein
MGSSKGTIEECSDYFRDLSSLQVLNFLVICYLSQYVAQKLVTCPKLKGQADKFIDHYAYQLQFKPGALCSGICPSIYCSVKKGYLRKQV